jgi:hypothetical protein
VETIVQQGNQWIAAGNNMVIHTSRRHEEAMISKAVTD